MSKSSMTVRDVFELPEPGAERSEGWKTFEDRVSKEVEGIKTAALPDIAEKVAELFEIPIPDIFLTSWKKADGIQALLEESRKAPETVMNTELGEHTINSQHRPHIEIRIQNKAVKKIEFTLRLTFDLKGFVLKIQDGTIRGMQTGLCEVRGKLEYQGLVVAEKKLSPITLPGSVSFVGAKIEREEEITEQKPPATNVAETHEASRTAGGLVEPKPSNVIDEAQEKLTISEVEGRKPPESVAAEARNNITVGKIEERAAADEVVAQGHEHTRTVEEVYELAAEPLMTEKITTGEGADISTPPETSVAEPPETSGTVDAVDIEAPPETGLPEPPEDSGSVEAVDVTMHPKIAVAESQQTSSMVEEHQERLTWEVGEPEEDAGTLHAATENTKGEAVSGESEAVESAQDVIDRMSRELADSRQTGGEVSEIADRAKAAS